MSHSKYLKQHTSCHLLWEHIFILILCIIKFKLCLFFFFFRSVPLGNILIWSKSVVSGEQAGKISTNVSTCKHTPFNSRICIKKSCYCRFNFMFSFVKVHFLLDYINQHSFWKTRTLCSTKTPWGELFGLDDWSHKGYVEGRSLKKVKFAY